MKIKAECIPCILNARFKELEMINADDKEKYDYATRVLENCVFLLKSGMSTLRLSTELFRFIKNISKTEDPYLCEKEKENRIALIWYDDLKAKLKSMDEDEKLNMTIRIVAVGNAIDPTIYTYSFKLENISKEFFTTNFTINDGLILNDVKNKKIVYLLDNCGEAVLDRLLAEVLRERGAQIVGIVKRGAFLNDVTLHEVEQIRLKDSFDKIIDTGTDAASIFLGRNKRRNQRRDIECRHYHS
ncbi:MAG: ARMT1-like domain-containing protein [Candidatus Baldrarchaeia archaeon]